MSLYPDFRATLLAGIVVDYTEVGRPVGRRCKCGAGMLSGTNWCTYGHCDTEDYFIERWR